MAAQPLTKADLDRLAVQSWEKLKAEVERFSDVGLALPGVVPDWSVKDLLGHIGFWTESIAENLRAVAAGREDELRSPGDEDTVNAWNDREWRLRRDRPLAAIKEEWLAGFDSARKALAEVPEAKLHEEVQGRTAAQRFAGDTFGHFEEHIMDIRAWRRGLETTEA